MTEHAEWPAQHATSGLCLGWWRSWRHYRTAESREQSMIHRWQVWEEAVVDNLHGTDEVEPVVTKGPHPLSDSVP